LGFSGYIEDDDEGAATVGGPSLSRSRVRAREVGEGEKMKVADSYGTDSSLSFELSSNSGKEDSDSDSLDLDTSSGDEGDGKDGGQGGMRVSSGVKAKPVQAGGGGASSSSRPSGGTTMHTFTLPITERVGLQGARNEGSVQRWANDAQRVAAELVLDRVTPGQGQYRSVEASARAYAADNTIPGAVTKSLSTVTKWVRILEFFRQGLEEVKVTTGRPSQKGAPPRKLSPRGRAIVEVYFAAVHLGADRGGFTGTRAEYAALICVNRNSFVNYIGQYLREFRERGEEVPPEHRVN
jgi:hypothetical protein